MKLAIGLLLTMLVASSYALNGKCRALVMSGAGSQGAYQAGVLMGLSNYQPNPDQELTWDVVAGVSAGSLNALAFGGFPAQDYQSAIDFVYALWNSIPNYKAFGNWPGGIIQGLFFKGGIFDLSPGKAWVKEQWGNKTVNRKVSFATTDSRTAEYNVIEYEPTGTLPSDYIESAFASSSIPAFFQPVERDGKTLIDGGVIWNIDIPTAVRRCRGIVTDDKNIIIDMIIVGDHAIEVIPNLKRYKTIDHFQRARNIGSFYNYMSDYRTSIQTFPNVNFRHLIYPSETLPGGFLPLDFSRSAVDGCFKVGDKDAKNSVSLGPEVHRDLVLEFADRMKNGLKPNLDQMISEKKREMGIFNEESK